MDRRGLGSVGDGPGGTADGDTIELLHVDDNEAFLDLSVEWLTRELDSVEVTSVTDPTTALSLLEEGDGPGVDCVVSDFDMPEMDGLTFLERVRERYPALPFVLFTGKGSEEIASEAISAGVTDYLQKGTGSDRFTVLANRVRNAVSQRRAEREAEASAARVSQVFDRITDAFVAIDRDWRFTYVNEQAEELLRAEAEELLGTRMHDAFPEVAGSAFEDAYRRAFEEQTPVTEEAHYEPLDAWFEVRAFPSEDGLSIYFRDVTERRRRERRFNAIFNNTYQFTGLLDTDGTLLEANETALRFGGVDREDVVGKRLWETYWFQHSTETRETAREEFQRAADGEFVRRELTVQGAEGPAVIDFSLKPVTDEDGELELIIPEGRDITERKERERELERKNERLEAFASVVSHDLKNPLSVAKGSLQLARESDDDEAALLAEAETALESMDTLIDDLLELAERGRVVDDPRPVDLRAVTERAARNLDDDAAISLAVDDVTTRADPPRLEQLLENLLTNAIEHGDRVVVDYEDGVLSVADDGPGVPADRRDRVFQPGYSDTEDGHGFGLAIARNIAEAHGWELTVTDAELGGARFEIRGVGPVEAETAAATTPE